MKRSLVVMVVIVLVTSSVCAADFNVLTLNFQPWGNTKFDARTMKITWTGEWEGGGWWLARDCSAYEQVEVEFKNPLPMDVIVTVIYSATDEKHEKLKTKKTILAGKKHITIALDPTYKVSIDGLGISGSAPGSVILKSLILKE